MVPDMVELQRLEVPRKEDKRLTQKKKKAQEGKTSQHGTLAAIPDLCVGRTVLMLMGVVVIVSFRGNRERGNFFLSPLKVRWLQG
jgi:hypothetical protein